MKIYLAGLDNNTIAYLGDLVSLLCIFVIVILGLLGCAALDFII